MKLPNIQIGFQVFVSDGGQEVGAVRQVAPFGLPELEIYVENAGGLRRAAHRGRLRARQQGRARLQEARDEAATRGRSHARRRGAGGMTATTVKE